MFLMKIKRHWSQCLFYLLLRCFKSRTPDGNRGPLIKNH